MHDTAQGCLDLNSIVYEMDVILRAVDLAHDKLIDIPPGDLGSWAADIGMVSAVLQLSLNALKDRRNDVEKAAQTHKMIPKVAA